MQPMNNRQNGRRRGRNNNQRPQGGSQRGGGDSGNRIDSRARGNAAQLLEKYKNMAREAQLAGDRVQTEYYLQFADHYFRVLADSRSRQEEQRSARQDDRYDSRDDADEGAPFGFGDEGEPGEPGDDPRDQNRDRDRGRDRDQGRSRRDRPERGERRDRPLADGSDHAAADAARDEDADDREDRPKRRDNGRARRRPFGEADAIDHRDDGDAGIDIAVLPPAIGAASHNADDAAEHEAPAPRRRLRARKPASEAAAAAED